MSTEAQLDVSEGFGQLAVSGHSIEIINDTLQILCNTAYQTGPSSYVFRPLYVKMDTLGNIIDTAFIANTYSGYLGVKIIVDSLGSIFILGNFKRNTPSNPEFSGVFIQKWKGSNLLWTKEYADSLDYVNYWIRDAVILDNYNFAITGSFGLEGDSIQPGNPMFTDSDIWLFMLDSGGNEILMKRYGDNTAQDQGYGIANGGNGTLLISGGRLFAIGGTRWLIETDLQGNILNEFIAPGNNSPIALDILRAKDGGVVYASSIPSAPFGYKNCIFKTDSAFNPEWQRPLGPFGGDFNQIRDIEQDDQGNIYVTGRQKAVYIDPDTAGFNGLLAKVSPSGDSIYALHFAKIDVQTLDDDHRFMDMKRVGEKIYLVGYTYDPYGPSNPAEQMWLISVDTNGCPHPDCIVGLQNWTYTGQDATVFPNPNRGYSDLN